MRFKANLRQWLPEDKFEFVWCYLFKNLLIILG